LLSTMLAMRAPMVLSGTVIIAYVTHEVQLRSLIFTQK